MKAKVARFYGWSHADMMSMSFKEFKEYHRAIDIINASETLEKLKVSVYSNYKKGAQEKAWKEQTDIIKYGVEKDKTEQRSLKDIALDLSRKMLNG